MIPINRDKSGEPVLPDPAPDFPRLLPVRLGRMPPPLGFTFGLGAFMTAVAAGAWYIGHKFVPGEKDGWVLYAFVGVFGFFGLLLLWSWFRQLLMARTPVPLVEISERPFHAGKPARIALIQRGPVKLKSLRANLVCLEQHITWREHSDGEPYRRLDEKMIHSQNLISASPVHASAGSDWHAIEEFTLPSDARRSVETSTHAILWRIEIWGKGPLLGSFLHRYEVRVG